MKVVKEAKASTKKGKLARSRRAASPTKSGTKKNKSFKKYSKEPSNTTIYTSKPLRPTS